MGKLLLLAAIIGSNNLAASLTLGALDQKKYRYRLVLIFAIFEFLMPLLGLLLGKKTSESIGDVAQFTAPLLLAGLGLFALWSARKPASEVKHKAEKLTTWRGLIVLELGLSVDNLLAGFSIGLGKTSLNPVLLAGVIALFSATYGYIGLSLGEKAHKRWARYAHIGTGLLLILLAVASWQGWLEPPANG